MTVMAANRPAPPAPGADRPKRRPLWRLTKWVLRWGSIVGIWCTVLLLAALAWLAYDLPNVEEATRLPRAPSLTIEAADGSFLAAVGDLYGEPVRLSDVPVYLPNAVIAIEDRRFWQHWGVDLLGIARAAYVNFSAGAVRQGGSTITQQVAKNLFLSHERSLRRKIQETLLAFWMEYRFSKTEILETYLNRAYFGGGAHGVDAAARRFFNKRAADITLWEAAVLAGLLKSPSRLAPTHDPEAAEQRARLVLEVMAEADLVKPRQSDRAISEAKPIEPPRTGHAIGGRYFSDWVVDRAHEYLTTVDRDLLIRTTLDKRLQDRADALVKARLLLRPSGADGWPSQAALVAMSPDGAVRAMVGGRDYGESQYNRVTQALRQPGSVFKTFTFLAALEAGYTYETTVRDALIRQGRYRPGNYLGRYYGDVSLGEALAKSMNSVTVRLAADIGFERTAEMARRLGIASRLTEHPSLVLGASEVRLLELTAAYAVLANGGRFVRPHGILEIRDREGRVLYPSGSRRPGLGERVLAPKTVEQANRMLATAVEQGTGRNARIGRDAAGKTGTTQGYRDAWFVGYTSDLVTGIWTGHDDNRPVEKMTGGRLPAQLWAGFVGKTLRDVPRPVQPRAPHAGPSSLN